MASTLARTIALAVVSLAACAPGSPAGQPTATTLPVATSSIGVPSYLDPSGSWIDIDLARQVLDLPEGGRLIAEYPVSTGVMTDPKYATPPGLYQVQSKDQGPRESSPGVLVSDVVMFDLGRGYGIHSLPMDSQGTVLDKTVGTPSTAGCVRVLESGRVFEFAQIGMRIWIH